MSRRDQHVCNSTAQSETGVHGYNSSCRQALTSQALATPPTSCVACWLTVTAATTMLLATHWLQCMPPQTRLHQDSTCATARRLRIFKVKPGHDMHVYSSSPTASLTALQGRSCHACMETSLFAGSAATSAYLPGLQLTRSPSHQLHQASSEGRRLDLAPHCDPDRCVGPACRSDLPHQVAQQRRQQQRPRAR